jgi:hypothetical protein
MNGGGRWQLILVEVLVLVLRLEVHRLALVSTGEGDIGMGRANNNAEAWLALSFHSMDASGYSAAGTGPSR